MLEAFGLRWTVKGEAIWKDRKAQERGHSPTKERIMADILHKHGGPRCLPGHHHSSCPMNTWQYICGTGTPHRCIHLDPSLPGNARLLRTLKALGLKVQKGKKMAAKKRKR